jgi:hypothetical protein
MWNKYISYKPQNTWPLLSQSSLPTWQPKMLVHKQWVIFNANKDTISHILLKIWYHSHVSFLENFYHLRTCEMVSHFTYIAVVRLWFGVSSHLVKPSRMNNSNGLLGLLVQKTSACIWLIRFPGLLAVFLIQHLFFMLPTDHTVQELAFLRRPPVYFNPVF